MVRILFYCKRVIQGVLGLILFFSTLNSYSQVEFDTSKFHKDWHWGVTPFFWLPWVDSKITVKDALEKNVNLSPGELIDILDFAIAFNTQYQKNNYLGIVDFQYISIGNTQQVNQFISAKLNGDIFFIEALAGYRFGNSKKILEVFGGTRIYVIDFKFSANGGFFGPREIKPSDTWADMVIGARGSYFINPRWILTLRGDIGFIGSQFAWNGMFSGAFVISHTVDVFLGFKGLGTTRNTNGDPLQRIVMNMYGFNTGVRIKLK